MDKRTADRVPLPRQSLIVAKLAPRLAWAATVMVVMFGWCGSGTANMSQDVTAGVGRITNFERPSSPNAWLVAPVDFEPPPDAVSPVFDYPAAAVARAWIAIVNAQPRTRIVGISPDGLQVEAEQQSAVFGFVDMIRVQVLPLTAERCTLVALSRARVGWWDLGVNRRRLRAWLEALQARLREAG
jgi:uncharacterized protein (DUF1499 family)